jgi:hypothetical protein
VVSRRWAALAVALLLWAVAGPAPAGAADEIPTPDDPAKAAEAGRQAEAAQAEGERPPQTGASPGFLTYRVFATQYEPNTPGSVEVAVPDKCAKFAALGNTGALSSNGCPAGYGTGLDYRVVVTLDDGRSATFPVKDVGPWNVDDNYWDSAEAGNPRPRRLFADLPQGRPEAAAAFNDGYHTVTNCNDVNHQPTTQTRGADQFGRCVLNPAGIDLSVAAVDQLGLARGQNVFLTATFLWEPVVAGAKPSIARGFTRYLRQTRSSGVADFTYTYGVATDIPVMGDWDGNGTETPGVYRDGRYYLRNSNTSGVADIVLDYGIPTDHPIVGDWNGDGVDTIGVFREGRWYLRNTNNSGVADSVWAYGDTTDLPVVGDWNGNGTDTFAVVRNGTWFTTNHFDSGVAEDVFGYGNPTGDIPIAGDWDGNGTETPGVVRSGTWYLVNGLNRGFADVNFGYGDPGDFPLPWK